MRRVLHLLPDLQRGGGQLVAYELAVRVDRTRFQPFVARLRPPDDLCERFAAAGVPVLAFEQGGGMVAAAIALARQVRNHRIDVLHVHSDADRKVGQIAALVTGTPVVGHLHSPWAHLRPMAPAGAGRAERGASVLKAAVRTVVERRTVRHYLAAGPAVAAFHRSSLHRSITVANNGVDIRRFAPAIPPARRGARCRLGLAPDARVLICVGRLAAGKGQSELIEALASLPDAQLLLVGEGEERASLERLAADLGIVERVQFIGDTPDVVPLLWAADVFVLASVSEGLPLSVIEAMACGLPVVTYDLPGLRDVVSDGVDGRLVPAGQRAAFVAALRSVVDDAAVHTAMGAAARRTAVDRFDAERMVLTVEAVYDAVAPRPRLRCAREHR
ncbi:MAG: glycosyltransferase [Acidimicrobiia bacterium]